MFFGMPARIINKNGKAIQSTLGFIGAIIKIIKQIKPTHLVVLFDGEHPNARTELLSEYKANRKDYSKVESQNNPYSQIKDIYNALSCMNIKHTEIQDVEVDDVVASYVYAYKSEMFIVISSFDSDFFQLIDTNVQILRYRGVNTAICDDYFIKQKFNITPMQYADFKSLTGDSSDNIKGAHMVGPKTASLLINEFNYLKTLLQMPIKYKNHA